MSLTSIVPNPDDLKRTMGQMPPLTAGMGQPPGPEPSGGMPSLGTLPPLGGNSAPSSAGMGGLKPIVTSPRQQQEQELQSKMSAFENPSKPQGFWQKLGHGLNVAANVAGTIVEPNLMPRIPGTMAYKAGQEDQRQNELAGLQKQDVSEQDASSKRNLESAQTGEAQARAAAISQTTEMKPDQADASLVEHGLRRDETTGKIVPDEASPVFQHQQLALELTKSTLALRKAQADVEQMKSDPNSPLAQQAQQRLAIAKQTQDRLSSMAGAMQERADAQMMNATREAKGTDLQGNPLPGAMLTDTGQTVGSSQAVNVRPTGTQRSKGNMAESADQQINDMKSIVAKRADVFGPAAGRVTDFNVWLGSQDPDAQRFRAARTIAGDHLAGTFGGRSEAALSALDAAIGHFKDNPAAITAGLNQLQEANQLFLKAGKVKTVGSNAEQGGGGKSIVQHSPSTGQYRYSTDGGKTWQAGQPKQ